MPDNPTPKRPSIAVKLLVIGLIALALLLPLRLIQNLVEERESRARSASSEIGDTWGGPQQLAGPLLRVPVRQALRNTDEIEGKGAAFFRDGFLVVLPENLQIEADVDTLERRRGIFETVVYTARLDVRATFKTPDLTRLGLQGDDVPWSKAEVVLGVGDLRGFRETPRIAWQGNDVVLEPAANAGLLNADLLTAPVPFVPGNEGAELTASLVLAGNGDLEFLPLGRDTAVRLRSNWNNPSFQGAFLPDAPQISADGFTAAWAVPYIARPYPQVWLQTEGQDMTQALKSSAFGADFLLPVDFYQKSERCTKYALLFIFMTFATFFLFDLLNELNIHPMQYLLVGVALCLFYQLLLAVSEHLGFTPGYAVAAAATVALISGYSSAVLRTRRRAVVLAVALAAMYGVLFFLVQLVSYALLGGSVVLFLMLAAFMYLTRGVDWDALGSARPANA